MCFTVDGPKGGAGCKFVEIVLSEGCLVISLGAAGFHLDRVRNIMISCLGCYLFDLESSDMDQQYFLVIL